MIELGTFRLPLIRLPLAQGVDFLVRLLELESKRAQRRQLPFSEVETFQCSLAVGFAPLEVPQPVGLGLDVGTLPLDVRQPAAWFGELSNGDDRTGIGGQGQAGRRQARAPRSTASEGRRAAARSSR